MQSKVASFDVINEITDGASVMIGGFGVPGTPFTLIEKLVEKGVKNLTIVKNDANENGMGVDWLLEKGQVKKLVASHIGLNSHAVSMMNAGKLEVELVPQGILAERLRLGGAGVPAFLSDIGLGTYFEKGKKTVRWEGRTLLVEPALRADFALIHADTSDDFGNLLYAGTAQNFNPLMAMAAERVFVEAEKLVPAGDIAPEAVQTPSPFVDAVIKLERISEVYGVIKR